MDSKIGLIIQLSGVLFVTALLFLISQSLKSKVLSYWKMGWLCLAVSLASLQTAFQFENLSKPFFIVYYLGEYVFGYFLISGCYQLTFERKFPLKIWYWIPPSLLVSFYLTYSTADFNATFNLHTFLMGSLFAVAFFTLKKTESSRKNLGWRVARFSLGCLAIDFYHYTILFSCDQAVTTAYLAYNPLIDLMLEILLGFGMVIFLFEEVRVELQQAHRKLEKSAHTDSLTTAFNRHAFYGFLNKKSDEDLPVTGCVGFFDIDDLKPINDRYGHDIGDLVIRHVTTAIRSLMRAEDLLFRWGGDEFFVLMVGMDEEMAQTRMSQLTELLKNVHIGELDEPLEIRVSFGFTNFADISELETAIKSADERMYSNKKARKLERAAMLGVLAKVQTPESFVNR